MNTLESFFQWLLAASLRASLLAGAVVCLQLALRRWLPARWRFALWLPVVLVLVAPALPESRFSVQNRFTEKPAPVVVKMEPLPAMEMSVLESLPETSPIVLESRWTPRQRMLAVWLFGTATVLFVGLLSYRRSMRGILREAVQIDASLANTIASVAEELRLRRAPRIIVSKSVGSPAVAGLLRPMLLLPADFPADFSPAESRLVLMHELTHLKRRDLPMNWLMCGLQAMHWFNPLLWLAFARMRADRETACDAQVLASSGDDCRAEYGNALLKLQTAPRHTGLSLAFVGIFERNAALRVRIQSIAAHRPAHPAWSLVAITIMVAVTMVGATQAESEKDAPPAAGAHTEQVRFSAKFIEIPEGKGKRFTIDADSSHSSSKHRSVHFIQSEKQAAAFLKQFNNDDVLASPTIITRSGQRAKIEVLREYAMPVGDAGRTENKQIGVTLEVTPTLDAGNIVLAVSATISKLTDPATGKRINGELKPGTKADYSEQKLDTTVTLKLGQSVTICGEFRASKPLIVLTPTLVEPKVDAAKPKAADAGDNASQQVFVDAFLLVRNGEALAAEGKTEEALKTLRTAAAAMEDFQKTAPAWNPEGVGMRLRRTKETIRKLENGEKLPAKEAQEGFSIRAKEMTSGADGTVTAVGNVTILAGDKVIKADSATIGDLRISPSVEKTAKVDFVLPALDLKDASVRHAADVIMEYSKAVDPDKKGVKIVVFPNVDAGTKITLSLKDIPVTEALKFIAELSKAKLNVQRGVIYLGTPAIAKPVAGKAGFVFSPYKADSEVDARGLPPNTEIECPYTGIPFLVP